MNDLFSKIDPTDIDGRRKRVDEVAREGLSNFYDNLRNIERVMVGELPHGNVREKFTVCLSLPDYDKLLQLMAMHKELYVHPLPSDTLKFMGFDIVYDKHVPRSRIKLVWKELF